jgi:hypothetical protein
MDELIRVDGTQNLYRDMSSGAIVNTDDHGYSQYIAQRERRKKEQDEIKNVKEELNEIKKLLKELLSKENN